MKTYLITGGAGFIGSHLSEALLARGDRVITLDNFSTGKLENVVHLTERPEYKLVRGDIMDARLVERLTERCDAIFHLAAAVGVDLIVKNPLQSLITNTRGSEIVLQYAYRYFKKVLITSTSEIYGKNTSGPLKEDDDRILGSPLKSRWAYSTSKAVDEILANAYWREKGLPTVIVRLFNTVGPRQTGTYGMVIPRFVELALKGEPLVVYGTGAQSRCFLDVADAVAALTKLMDHPGAVGDVFNLGSKEEVTMDELAHRVIELSGSKSTVVHIPYDQAYEAGFEDMMRRVPDTSKVHKLIGFEPSSDLNEILTRVIQHFRDKGKG